VDFHIALKNKTFFSKISRVFKKITSILKIIMGLKLWQSFLNIYPLPTK